MTPSDPRASGTTDLGQLQGLFLRDPREISVIAEDPGDAHFAEDGFQIVGSRNGQFGQT